MKKIIKPVPTKLRAILLAGMFIPPGLVCAQALQTAPVAADPAPARTLAPVVITANPLRPDADTAAVPVEIIEGRHLLMADQTSLGVALESLPGVHADTFGSGASRPVIRGQTLPRVQVLTDGGAVFDASGVSPDHAVMADPMLSERIEVIRGPGALLYSGGAIGGVVNVIDGKVPRAVPENGVEGHVDVRGATGLNERAGAFSVTGGDGPIAVHVEGMKRRTGDYRVPDWKTNRLAGSDQDTSAGSVGLSWIHDRGYTGIAVSRTRSRYGIPGHSHGYDDCHPHGDHLHCGGHGGHDDHDDHDHDHGHEEAEAPPRVDLKSQRIDLRGEYAQPFTGIERISWRAGFADYRHDELEHDEVAATYKNRGRDLRLEVAHAPIGGWEGVVAVQAGQSDFRTSGEERFMPSALTRTQGLALLEAYETGNWRFELGARYDRQRIRPDNTAPAYGASGASFSAAATWQFAPQYALSVSLTRAQRMPSAQELYADGVHLASNTYERGDTNLDKETAHGIDIGLRKTDGDLTFNVNVFHNEVRDYIYARTLDRYEDFRLIQYTQRDARFTGLEAGIDYRVSHRLTMGVFGDLVHGRVRGDGNLPRMPGARLGWRGQANWGPVTADATFYRVFSQHRIGAGESETPGYNMLNLGLSYDTRLGQSDLTLYVRARNLLNVQAFNHASYLAQAAPLPGRSIMAGVRLDY
ncbi:TonB-dependent receptor domain-containing protein [Pusillimonas sp. T2]|uniref:TonB-dependent receptor domain-containing protein n=1 Tax=Pusillimonas sp. T2 TaxID=1548123 RepID=UPI00117ACA77|nr:TonB-dependent receptor [Pusillimonas sp. T2]